MARFATILAGPRARKRVALPLTDGRSVDVDLRVLTPLETLEVMSAARADAVARGVTEPSDGDAIYDLALQVHTLVRACIDPDSSESEPVPFFESAEQVLQSELLGRDTIAYLFALYEQHVESFALSPRDLDEAGLRAMIDSAAGGDMLPFLRLRPGMQWICVRSMAALLRSYLRDRSRSIAPSEDGTSSTASDALQTTQDARGDSQ